MLFYRFIQVRRFERPLHANDMTFVGFVFSSSPSAGIRLSAH